MASQPLITFPLPDTPSQQQLDEDPDSALSWVKDRMKEVLAATKKQRDGERILDQRCYIGIYTVIHNLCEPSDRQSRHGTPFIQQFYCLLQDLLGPHYDSFRTNVYNTDVDAPDKHTALLTAYLSEWQRHLALQHLNCGLFGVVDRRWAQPENYERRQRDEITDVCSIRNLHMRFWRLRVLYADLQSDKPLIFPEDYAGTVLEAAARLQEKMNDTSNEGCNQNEAKLLDEVFETYDQMGLHACRQTSGKIAWKLSMLL